MRLVSQYMCDGHTACAFMDTPSRVDSTTKEYFMNTTKLALSAAFMSISALTFTVYAQTQAPMTNQEIDAQYRSDQKKCDAMKGDQKDVCEKQAKAARDSAKADAKQAKEQAESRHEATKEKRESAYDVAKAKCDTLSGNAKDACMADAKTRYGK
jgi:hypothetical protein